MKWTATEAATGLRLGFTRAGDYGMFDIYLDGKIGPTVNLYDTRVTRMEHQLTVAIAPGPHTLTFKCTGKDERSKRFFFGLIKSITPAEGGAQAVGGNHEGARSHHPTIAAGLPPTGRTGHRGRFAKICRTTTGRRRNMETTMRRVVSAVLGMPISCIYESPTPGSKPAGRQRINDFELATRLAQFFWSSIPDDTLLELAEAGNLSEPQVLNAQIDRMMNDKKVSRFLDNFPAQWLQLDRLVTSIPDPKQFPYFYYHGYRTSMHMMSEPLLLFETVLVENRSVMDLIAPDFTWESTMLKANYAGHNRGGRDVQVQLFKRVPVTDPRRGGLITSAAVLTMTSTPSPQPITRGTWINAVIFNDPPKPPPADVPPLDESNEEDLAKLTIRERLAAHRKRADCAGCHNQIDPLGFALENFGPTGCGATSMRTVARWMSATCSLISTSSPTSTNLKTARTTETTVCAGLHRASAELRPRPRAGSGRYPALEAMAAQAVTGDDQLRSILKAVALSEPFHHKNTLNAKP